jgi:hypothetical protein
MDGGDHQHGWRNIPITLIDLVSTGGLSVIKLSPNRGALEPPCSLASRKEMRKQRQCGPPQMVNKVQLDEDIVVWVTTPSIQLTANAPVMPNSASATAPYASPPTMVLDTKPVRIPIVSNHQGASIRSVSPQTRWRWNRGTTFKREPMKVRGQNGCFPQHPLPCPALEG